MDAELDDHDAPLMLTQHGEDPDGIRVTDAFDEEFSDDDEEYEQEEDFQDNADEDMDVDVDVDDVDINQEELEDELRDLQMDTEQQRGDYFGGHGEKPLSNSGPQERRDPSVKSVGLDLLTLDKITALRAAFPMASAGFCENTLRNYGNDETKAFESLMKTYVPQLALQQMLRHEERLHSSIPSVAGGAAKGANNAASMDEDADGESEAESVGSLAKHYDNHGFPSGSILAGAASRQMAEELRRSGQEVKMPVHTRFDEDADVAQSPRTNRDDTGGATPTEEAVSAGPDMDLGDAISSSDEGAAEPDSADSSSSDESSDEDSDGDSDSGPEVVSSKKKPERRGGAKVTSTEEVGSASDSEGSGSDSDDDSSSSSDEDDASADDSSDDSDMDSESDGSGSNDGIEETPSHDGHEASDNNDSDSSSDESSSDGSDDEPPVPKKAKEVSAPAQITRASPPPTTFADAKMLLVAGGSGSDSASTNTKPTTAPNHGSTRTQRRNSRRRAKNKAAKATSKRGITTDPSLADGRIGIPLSVSIAAKKAALLERLHLLQDMAVETVPSKASPDPIGSIDQAEQSPNQAPVSSSPQRKATLDVNAGRRMVFGALGLKNPKTKADEEKIHSTLMENVRVHTNPRLHGFDAPQTDREPIGEPQLEEDPEAWHQKINYTAVECCQEGVQLSKPPFPFVQRWDPQQQGKHRGKKKKRQYSEAYEDYGETTSKKRRYTDHEEDQSTYYGGEASYFGAGNESANADIILNYDDEPVVTHADHTGEEDDDLPPLPDDLSCLPVAQPDDCKPGAILTWKQLLLSKATNWQPQISSMTGAVIEAHDCDALRLRLAKRDRSLGHNEKTYDDDGERVYDKFEFPGMDDELEEDAELGYYTLSFADMIEPRVLKPSNAADDPGTVSISDHAATDDQGKPIAPTDSLGRSATDLSTNLDYEPSQRIRNQADAMEVDIQHTNETVVPETVHEAAHESKEDSEALQPAGVDASISEERQREISQLISDAGFRKEIDPCITEAKTDLSSPSRQLEEMSVEAAASFSSNFPPASPGSGAQEQTRSVPQNASLGTSYPSDYVESQPILLEPFNGFSDDVGGSVSGSPPGSRVGYPKLLENMHSDSGSVRSGGQPEPDMNLPLEDDGPMEPFGTQVPRDSFPETSDPLSSPKKAGTAAADSPAASETSINSFPSIGEVFTTASTSDNAQAPSRAAVMSAIKARKSNISPDLGYDAAMRKLDEVDWDASDSAAERASGIGDEGEDAADDDEGGEEDEDEVDSYVDDEFEDESNLDEVPVVKEEPRTQSQSWRLSSFAQKLAEKPIERPAIKKEAPSKARLSKPHIKPHIKAERLARESPLPRPRIPRASSQSQQSSFIPAGSQVISLASSSPEPVEDYADDDIDETYEDPEMPNGSGWVSKDWKAYKGEYRGVSVPAASVPREQPLRRTSASQGRTNMGTSSRKKTMARVF